MEIKAYSFEQNSHAFAEVKRKVSECVQGNTIYFESYSDPKALFTDLSECIDDTDLILIGVESKVYLKFKPILIKAFNFTPAYSDEISNAIGDALTDEKLKKAHTLVPNESTELISKDGLYSGFYINDNEQYIIVFPLIEEVVPSILQKSGLPFFTKEEDKLASFEEIASRSKATSKAEALIEKLTQNNIRIAIPSTPAARMLKEDIRACEGYRDCVYFTPFVNDTGVDDPKQYAAHLAKSAMELRNTQMGATLSNIFREKKGETVTNYYSFISISTEDKVIVKKLYADAGESVDNLILEATNELYLMMDKYIDEIIFKMTATEEEIAKYEQALIEAEIVSDIKPEEQKSKKGKIIAAVVITVITAICIFLGFYFSDYFVSSADAPSAEVLQNNGNPAAQTQANTLPQPQPQTIPQNTVAEITEGASETSIFGVTTTLPTVTPNTDFQIIYNPNSNTGSNTTTTEEPTTQKETEPTTTEKATETEKQTQAPETTEEEIIF